MIFSTDREKRTQLAVIEIARQLDFAIMQTSTDDGEWLEIQSPDGFICYTGWAEPTDIDTDEWLDWMKDYFRRQDHLKTL